jgi:hypothetical protein
MVYYLFYVDSWLWVTMYVLERKEARNRMNSLKVDTEQNFPSTKYVLTEKKVYAQTR